MRAALEVADIFRTHGPAWRRAHAGHISLDQLKAMSAIEACRTAELGGHVERCEDCAHVQIAYNSLYGDFFVKPAFFSSWARILGKEDYAGWS